jgi:hypothetical protein
MSFTLCVVSGVHLGLSDPDRNRSGSVLEAIWLVGLIHMDAENAPVL